MSQVRHSSLNMLEGNIVQKLFIFAWPLAVTGVLQQLFNGSDVAVLGLFAGKHAMAAVGSNTPVVGALLNLLLGLSLGANVVIARLLGAGQASKVPAAVSTAMILGLLSGIAMALFGYVLSAPLLQLLQVPPEVADDALTYLRVFLVGIPGISVYNFEAAIMRSRGDSLTPMKVLAVGSLINIALNLLFVSTFEDKTAGVAWATAIANTFNGVALFFVLNRGASSVRFDPKRIVVDSVALKEIVRIGLPAGIQGTVFSISNLVIQASINGLGADAAAASAAAFAIEINVWCVISAFSQAVTTFVSQNYGAKNLPRCRQITRLGFWLQMGVVTSLSLLILIFSKTLLGFFNPDPLVIELGFIRILYVVLPECISCGLENLSGAMRGYGCSMPPALICIVGICGVRILWVMTVFKMIPTFSILMLVYPVSWLVALAILYVVYVRFMRRLTV